MERLVLNHNKSIKLIFLYLLLSFSTTSYSKVSIGQVEKIKNELNSHSVNLNKIRNKIKKIDYLANRKQKEYKLLTQEKRKIEIEIFKIKNSLDQMRVQLNGNSNYLKKMLAKYIILLKSKSAKKDLNSFVSKKIILQKIMDLVKAEKKLKLEIYESEVRVAKLNKDYVGRSEQEAALSSLMYSLDEDKIKFTKSYVETTDSLSILEKKLSKLEIVQRKNRRKNKNIAQGNIKSEFLLPLSSYSKIENKKKRGVTFYHRKKQALRASASGTVAYTGRLSTFGQVIIIDHGKQKRTTLLGEFQTKVKKNQKVKKGEIIGMTTNNQGSTSKIYFELRENEKIKNTLAYLDL